VIAIDTNLLTYAHRSRTPEHRRARQAIERAAASPKGWGVAVPSVAEFLAVVTHPSDPRPSTVDEAERFIDGLVAAGCELWGPGPGLVDALFARAARLDVSGPRVFDLQIALTALDNGATELWTHDAQFVKVPGLRVADPLRT
jgi:uncharacterized protein